MPARDTDFVACSRKTEFIEVGCLHAKLYVMTFQELDELVYALYGLTPEEIKIVEGAK